MRICRWDPIFGTPQVVLEDGAPSAPSEPAVAVSASSAAPTRARTWPGSRVFVDAGFDHIHVHQIGANQETFFRFYGR
jgi:hypothetical protein